MRSHRWIRRSACAAALTACAFPAVAGAAQPTVGLGTADPFGILAGSTVTNTGPSTVNGDLGLSPGAAVTGFGGAGNGTVNGATHVNDAAAMQAKADLDTAYADAAGRPFTALPAADLTTAGILGPGVYRSPTLGLTGSVTLDAGGDPSAVFIFQVDSTLITDSASSVKLVNGAQPCNVFWQVGSSATLGSGSSFVGTILAQTSITVNNAVTIPGRLLARTAAVTLINDTITRPACAAPPPPPAGPPAPAGPAAGPSPATTPTPTPTPPASAGGPPTATPTPTPTTPAPASGPAPVAGSGPTPTVAPGNASSVSTAAASLAVTATQAIVTGQHIAQVVFRLDGRVMRPHKHDPLRAPLHLRPGRHTLTARVIFTTGRRPVTLRRHLTVKHPVKRDPRPSPSRSPKTSGGFTG